MQSRLAAPPQLAQDDMLGVVVGVLESPAEDCLSCFMHIVEDLHAGARQVGARSMDRRKQLPVHPVLLPGSAAVGRTA